MLRKKLFTLLFLFASALYGVISVHQSQAQVQKGPAVKDNYKFTLLPPPPGVYETDNPYTVVKENFTLILRDGVILDGTKFYPSEPNIYLPNGYPCVIMVHGYGDRKETLEHFAQAQATYNYVCYTYSVRGQGNSGGLSNLISIVEAEDLKELVNYIKNDNTGLDSSKIVLMGGSQGGTLPYMAACNGMKVGGIISALTSPEFATSWIENGSIKMTFLWTIEYTPDSVRYTPVVDRMSDWCYASGTKNDKWDSLAYYVPIGRDFKDKVSNNTVPLLIENSWQDYFFNARQGIQSYPQINAEHIVYMGAVMGHGGDISETENIWHMSFFNDWFYHHIWNWPSNYLNYEKFQYASTTYPKIGDMWTFTHASSPVWPPANIQSAKLYPKNNGELSATPENDANKKKDFENNVKSNTTMEEVVYAEFTGTSFKDKFKIDSLVFTSPVIATSVKMIGVPKLVLDYSSDATICQYNAQIFEVLPSGEQHLVTRINYTDRNYVKNQRRQKTIEGLAHSHILKPGNKIKLVFTNLDRTNDDYKFLHTNPHVLPVLAKSKNQVYLKNTYLDLPLEVIPGDGFASGIFEEQNTSSRTDSKINLSQNYPNPFNPTTTISFQLPEGFSNNVSLKIFDITGKEITTLVNANLTGGSYSFNWNADKNSTGVYFYKLEAGTFSEVRRMILIK